MEKTFFFQPEKLSYIRLHWKTLSWRTLKDGLSWFFVFVTVIGSLLAFLPEDERDSLLKTIDFCWSQGLFVAIVLLFLLIALFVHLPKMRAVYTNKNYDIRVIIECCDLLKQDGLKVIHTVDTFDTELNKIISPRSLHGAFLQLGLDQKVDIDKQIDQALTMYKPIRSNKNLPGRSDQYALGTICPNEIKGNPFCCVSFTHLQPNGTIEISKDEYIKTLKRMWHNLSNPRLRHEVVNVAVMGNQFVDLPAEFSTEQKIDLMIQTFFAAAREKSCCRTLRICIHPSNVMDVDFEQYPVIIEHLAKRPVL